MDSSAPQADSKSDQPSTSQSPDSAASTSEPPRPPVPDTDTASDPAEASPPTDDAAPEKKPDIEPTPVPDEAPKPTSPTPAPEPEQTNEPPKPASDTNAPAPDQPAPTEDSKVAEPSATPEPVANPAPPPPAPEPTQDTQTALTPATPSSVPNQTPPPAPAGPPASSTKHTMPVKAIVTAIVVVAIIAAIGFAAFAYFSPKAKPAAALPSVKIGVLMAFTGGSSSMGYGEMKGIQLAQKQLGADNIELVQMDSQCDPTVAPQAMQRLVDQHVVAVIGDGCSSASVAALPLANANKIPMVSPSASSPSLSIPNDYFFRVVPPDTYQGAYLAKAVYARGIKTVGIFYTNEPYGINMNTVFTKEFEALGGKVLTSVNATSGVINLASQIAAIKATKPQGVVFVSNSVTTGAAALQLARSAGITAPFFGGDGLYDQTLISSAQSAAQGLTLTTFPTGTAAFKQLLYTNDQGEQLYAAAEGYDAFETLYLAVKHGATTGPAIKAELPNVSFNGVSAQIKFDQNGDEDGANYPYALLQVKDGSFVNAQ